MGTAISYISLFPNQGKGEDDGDCHIGNQSVTFINKLHQQTKFHLQTKSKQ